MPPLRLDAQLQHDIVGRLHERMRERQSAGPAAEEHIQLGRDGIAGADLHHDVADLAMHPVEHRVVVAGRLERQLGMQRIGVVGHAGPQAVDRDPRERLLRQLDAEHLRDDLVQHDDSRLRPVASRHRGRRDVAGDVAAERADAEVVQPPLVDALQAERRLWLDRPAGVVPVAEGVEQAAESLVVVAGQRLHRTDEDQIGVEPHAGLLQATRQHRDRGDGERVVADARPDEPIGQHGDVVVLIERDDRVEVGDDHQRPLAGASGQAGDGVAEGVGGGVGDVLGDEPVEQPAAALLLASGVAGDLRDHHSG